MCLLDPVIPPPWLGTTDLKYIEPVLISVKKFQNNKTAWTVQSCEESVMYSSSQVRNNSKKGEKSVVHTSRSKINTITHLYWDTRCSKHRKYVSVVEPKAGSPSISLFIRVILSCDKAVFWPANCFSCHKCHQSRRR